MEFYSIPGIDSAYSISKKGCVKAEEKTWNTGRNGNTIRIKPACILKPFLKPNGYFHVQILVNGQQRQYAIHTLLAKTFISNPQGKKCVNHIDGDKLNNDISNLEWATYKENNDHALRTGIRINPSGSKNAASVPVEVYKNGILIGSYCTIKEAAANNGISYNKLYDILRGRSANQEFKIKRIYKGKVL